MQWQDTGPTVPRWLHGSCGEAGLYGSRPARDQVELQLRPIEVRFEWEPKDAIVRVDNRPVSEQYPMMELSEGPHRVEVLAPPGQPYKSTVRDIEVRRDMEPVRLLLQRLNTLGAEVPRGEPK